MLLRLACLLLLPLASPAGAGLPPQGQSAEDCRALLEAGRLPEAIACLDGWIAREPGAAQAYRWRAGCKARRGDALGALADVQRALELDPRVAEAWMLRGDLVAESGDYGAAAHDYRQGIECEPSSPVLHARLGLLLGAVSDDARALEHLERALALDPAAPGQLQLWRHLLALEQGRGPEASRERLREWLAGPGAAVEEGWAATLARFHTGELGRDGLLRAAVASDSAWAAYAPSPKQRLSQALYHLALGEQVLGEKKAALADYRAALETFEAGSWEWQGARLRLRRLADELSIPPYVGIVTQALDPRFAELARLDPSTCTAIGGVDPRSFAGRAGLREGDVVLRIQGEPASPEKLREVLARTRPGDWLRLELARGSQRSACALLVDMRLQ